jgi:hypothetical protein
MKIVGTIVVLVSLVALAWFVTKWQLSKTPLPGETINETGIKSDLQAIAQAERKYMASHGSYASIDELQHDGLLAFSGLRWGGYFYTATVNDGQHFEITAQPAEISKAGWPIYHISETMRVWESAGFLE